MRHPVDYEPSQDFGENPTSQLPAGHWIIKQFGNYQPDGHTGVDYPCPIGTQVKAAADGVVLRVGYLSGSYASNPWWIAPSFAGYVYVVDHGHFIGIYGHCKDNTNWVNKGDRVKEGQTLGLSGNTGASTGPHLHFECLPDGYVLNSYMYGRINPASLFIGSVSYASESITPLEEDDVTTPEQIETIVSATNKGTQAIADHVFDRLMKELAPVVADATLTKQVPHKHPITGKDDGETTSLATMAGYFDFQAVQTRLANASPQDIASVIPEEIAAEGARLISVRVAA